MTMTSIAPERLECKYCKVSLTNITASNVGFVTCPDCKRTYLKMPNTSLATKNVTISAARKKILDVFIDPSDHEKAIDELKANLQVQIENLEALKTQKENLNLENLKANKLLQEKLAQTQGELEEVSIINQELQISLNEVNFELKRVQDIIAEKNQIILKIKNDFEVVSEKLRLKEFHFDVLEKESGLKSSAMANISNDLHEVKNLCVVYEEKISALELELQKEKERISHLNMSLDVIPDLEVELEKAKLTIQELQKTIESSDHKALHELSLDQITVLNEEINALKTDIKDYTATITELQDQLAAKNDVIRNKETEIYTLSHQELEKPVEPPNLFSFAESDEILKLRDRVRRLEQTEQKLENLETELEISRDELSKAKKEIVDLNGLLEKAFYENQKNQTEPQTPVAASQKLASVARDIEKREDDLMEFAYDVNQKIDRFVAQFSKLQCLAFDVAVIREDVNGRQVHKLFAKDTLLTAGDLEIKKIISYKAIINKGHIYFQQEDERNVVLKSLKIDFSSNNSFFLSDEEFETLTPAETEVEIREEYTLHANGELSVAFYRNNGFKRFDAPIGKLILSTVSGIEKFTV